MIGCLNGVLAMKAPPQLMIDVGGVGYELEAPMSTIYDLPALGESVRLLTHQIFKEDGVALYGFLTDAERSLFRLLLKVSGIGGKSALAILSGVDPQAFARLIGNADLTALTRIPGIGKKTAERLIVELKDKLGAIPGGGGTTRIAGVRVIPTDAKSEATEALLALGYRPPEVSRWLESIKEPDLTAEALIRRALTLALK
jgi:holliday junction DNA helicase RuvA